MELVGLSCEEFVRRLAGGDPVPGGGGASALAGALGTALGGMVCSLTLGKKKYAGAQADITALQAKAGALQGQLLELVRRDAEVFEPLSRAYKLPRDTEEERACRADVMEKALYRAAEVPLEIVDCCCEAICLHGELGQKGASIAISDVGVGVALCKAALQGASLNVYANTQMMADRARAEAMNSRAAAMLDKYLPKANAIYQNVEQRLK